MNIKSITADELLKILKDFNNSLSSQERLQFLKELNDYMKELNADLGKLHRLTEYKQQEENIRKKIKDSNY